MVLPVFTSSTVPWLIKLVPSILDSETQSSTFHSASSSGTLRDSVTLVSPPMMLPQFSEILSSEPLSLSTIKITRTCISPTPRTAERTWLPSELVQMLFHRLLESVALHQPLHLLHLLLPAQAPFPPASHPLSRHSLPSPQTLLVSTQCRTTAPPLDLLLTPPNTQHLPCTPPPSTPPCAPFPTHPRSPPSLPTASTLRRRPRQSTPPRLTLSPSVLQRLRTVHMDRQPPPSPLLPLPFITSATLSRLLLDILWLLTSWSLTQLQLRPLFLSNTQFLSSQSQLVSSLDRTTQSQHQLCQRLPQHHTQQLLHQLHMSQHRLQPVTSTLTLPSPVDPTYHPVRVFPSPEQRAR